MKNREWLALVTRGQCMACQKETDDAELEIDHVIPKKWGASRCLCNSRLLCRKCNDLKGTEARDYRDEFVRTRLIAGCGHDCHTCGWWHSGGRVADGGAFGVTNLLPVLREVCRRGLPTGQIRIR